MTVAENSGTYGLGRATALLHSQGDTNDRLIRARIDREREEARLQGRIAARQAAARLRQENAEARRGTREKARQARAARRAAAAAWCQARAVDLLFIPVIGVPGALSWTGMADYGRSEFGTPGLALPALSEGGMWAFAAATTITRRGSQDKPVWHLRLGTLIFAAYGAALNFLHGLGRSGLLTGVCMVLISVAGVTAHQLITAGPRRSRTEREQARIERAIARRERAARRAAIQSATIQLDGTGRARLVFEPGTATLSRGRVSRSQLDRGDDIAVLGATSVRGLRSRTGPSRRKGSRPRTQAGARTTGMYRDRRRSAATQATPGGDREQARVTGAPDSLNGDASRRDPPVDRSARPS